MPKFLCLQRKVPANDTTGKKDMQAMQAAFATWFKTHQENLVDPGGRFGQSQLVTETTAEDVVKVSSLGGGYMIVAADNIEGAIAIARDCPGLVSGGSGVEVIELPSQ